MIKMSRPIPIPASSRSAQDEVERRGKYGSSPQTLYYHIESVIESNSSLSKVRYGVKDVFYLGFCAADRTYLTCLRSASQPGIIYVLSFLCDERSNHRPQCFSFDFYSVSEDLDNETWLNSFTGKAQYIALLNDDGSARKWSLGMALTRPKILSKSTS